MKKPLVWILISCAAIYVNCTQELQAVRGQLAAEQSRCFKLEVMQLNAPHKRKNCAETRALINFVRVVVGGRGGAAAKASESGCTREGGGAPSKAEGGF